MNPTLAAGFETPLIEIIAVAGVVCGVIAGFAIYSYRRHRAYVRRRARDDAARYYELSVRYGLTPTEESVVNRLAAHLRPGTGKHVLLHSQGVFNQASALAIADDEVSTGQISALRVKLDFTGRPIGMQPRSSVDIPPGSAVLIESGRHTPIHGTVLDAGTDALRLRIDAEGTPLPPGRIVHIVYQNDAGVFEFDSAVLLREGAEVRLQHSEKIESVQQRGHYRRAIRLPVFVSNALTSSESELAEFIDIGGGGASLTNPGNRYAAGDTVELTFHPEGDTSLNLIATVIRTSKGGAVIHVKYGNIRESSRDRVYRLLFHPPPHDTAQGSSQRSHPS